MRSQVVYWAAQDQREVHMYNCVGTKCLGLNEARTVIKHIPLPICIGVRWLLVSKTFTAITGRSSGMTHPGM